MTARAFSSFVSRFSQRRAKNRTALASAFSVLDSILLTFLNYSSIFGPIFATLYTYTLPTQCPLLRAGTSLLEPPQLLQNDFLSYRFHIKVHITTDPHAYLLYYANPTEHFTCHAQNTERLNNAEILSKRPINGEIKFKSRAHDSKSPERCTLRVAIAQLSGNKVPQRSQQLYPLVTDEGYSVQTCRA